MILTIQNHVFETGSEPMIRAHDSSPSFQPMHGHGIEADPAFTLACLADTLTDMAGSYAPESHIDSHL